MTQPHPETSEATVCDHLEMSLSVSLAAARKARALIEDNYDKDDPTCDGVVLGRVYALLLDVTSGLAGAHGILEQRRKMEAIVLEARAPMRLVK